MKLNLGAGFDNAEGFVRFDCSPAAPADVRGDVGRLPFRNGSFEEIKAHHILEHIEKRDHVRALNECHRVLAPGGTIEVEVPVFPFPISIADPTHVSLWHSLSFDYFCQGRGHDEHMTLYGILPWKLVGTPKRMGDGEIVNVTMEKL